MKVITKFMMLLNFILLVKSLWIYHEHFEIFTNPKRCSLQFLSIHLSLVHLVSLQKNIDHNDANPLSHTLMHLQQSKQIGLFIFLLHFHKSCNCCLDYQVRFSLFRCACVKRISWAQAWIITWPNSLIGLLKSVKGQVITLILWTGFSSHSNRRQV